MAKGRGIYETWEAKDRLSEREYETLIFCVVEIERLAQLRGLPKIKVYCNMLAQRRAGVFKYYRSSWRKESWIEISKSYLKYGREFMIDTARHEFAHYEVYANGYINEGHGPIWKKIATEVGADPSRCFDSQMKGFAEAQEVRRNEIPSMKYTYTCPCGRTHNRSRRYSVLQSYKRCCKYCKTLVKDFSVKQNF